MSGLLTGLVAGLFFQCSVKIASQQALLDHHRRQATTARPYLVINTYRSGLQGLACSMCQVIYVPPHAQCSWFIFIPACRVEHAPLPPPSPSVPQARPIGVRSSSSQTSHLKSTIELQHINAMTWPSGSKVTKSAISMQTKPPNIGHVLPNLTHPPTHYHTILRTIILGG